MATFEFDPIESVDLIGPVATSSLDGEEFAVALHHVRAELAVATGRLRAIRRDTAQQDFDRAKLIEELAAIEAIVLHATLMLETLDGRLGHEPKPHSSTRLPPS